MLSEKSFFVPNASSSSQQSSDDLFKDRNHLAKDEKLKIFQRLFKRVNEDVSEQNQLELDLKTLGEKVFSYDPQKMKKIKRMGLIRFQKKFLQQSYLYLLGLHKYTMRKRGKSYYDAFFFLQKSVRHSKLQINALSKKTLLKMLHILKIMYEKKVQEIFLLKRTGVSFLKRRITGVNKVLAEK